MEAYFCFVFTLCVLLAGKASATECGIIINTNNSQSGDITQPTPTNTSCEFYINTTVNVFIQVRNLVLQDNDTLEIFDVYNTSSKALIAKFKNGDIAPFPVVTGLQNNITIIFTPTTPGVNSTSTWTLEYNTNCIVNIASDWSHKVDSPKYLPSTGKLIKCQYTITCNLPLDRLAALSFLSLSVFNNSRLSLTSGSNMATLTNTSEGEDFFAEDTKPISLSLEFIAAEAQSFSVIVEPVVKDCSGSINISKTHEVQRTFSNPGLSYVCRWVVTSTLSRITARINSLQIAGGYDSMTFTDGGSSKAGVNKTLSSASTDWLFLSVGKKAVISLQLGDFAGVRSLNMSLIEADAGGPLFGQGQLSGDDKQVDQVTYYQLYANVGQLVKVNITERKLNECTVVFYNGLQPSDPVLLSLNANGPYLTTVIVNSPVLVAITRVVKTSVFKATFSSLEPGCDQLATGISGSWNYKDTAGDCRYTVVPQTVGQVILYVDSLTLRSGDTLKVFSGVDSTTVIAQFMMPAGEVVKDFNFRQVYGEAGQGISVVLTRNTTVTSQSETAIRYQVVNKVCGGDLQNSGEISTPNYPNEYPINAKCSWTIKDAKPNEMLLLNFQSLHLAQKHSILVTDNNVEVARYGGDILPTADLLINATNSTKIEFSSPTDGDESQVALGAKFDYQRPNCGANLTKLSDVIFLPSEAGSHCVWTINVKNVTDKSNSTNIVKFNLSNLNITLLKQFLKVHDGGSLKDKELDVSLNQTNYSLRNILVFQWDLTQNLTEKFNISYQTKTCGSTELCQNGLCMRPEWLCNRINDCGDNTDELNCTAPIPPVTTTTQKPQEADYSGWVKSGWVPACLFIGILLGLVLYFVVPKLYRRIRGRGGNYSRMGDDRPVVT